ncbi:phospholipase D-like domain-containing protein [Acidisoma sp. C75]
MKVVYVPVFRVAISYAVTLGRRWSLLDHILLIELAEARRSLTELSAAADLPERVVIEALINLLRVGWIEVRSDQDKAIFAATSVGKRRAADNELQPELKREVKWTSLCMERLTGRWLRTDDLELVYQGDLPDGAQTLEPVVSSLNYDDPDVRELINLSSDEGFDGFLPAAKPPARPFARVIVSHGQVTSGVPAGSSMGMLEAISVAAGALPEEMHSGGKNAREERTDDGIARCEIRPDDVVAGGPEHLHLLRSCLSSARTHIVVHSCFLNPSTVRQLLPDLNRAAARNVRVDLLWGLREDVEANSRARPLSETLAELKHLDPRTREKVHLSPFSSKSHAKIIVYDELEDGSWTSVVGSCNFLSSEFDWLELSVRVRSHRIASRLLAHLIAGQIPASGAWPPAARRMEKSWALVRRLSQKHPEQGRHKLDLLVDADHYAAVTRARDVASRDIILGCDLFGAAAETSVLVPLESAARHGVGSRLVYNRASKYLRETGIHPVSADLVARGLDLQVFDKLHAKFLAWDDDALAITSFNWLATVVAETRSRGAEIGLMATGPGLRDILTERVAAASGGLLDLRVIAGRPPTGSSRVDLSLVSRATRQESQPER